MRENSLNRFSIKGVKRYKAVLLAAFVIGAFLVIGPARGWASSVPIYDGMEVSLSDTQSLQNLFKNIIAQNQNAIYAFPVKVGSGANPDLSPLATQALVGNTNDVIDLSWYISDKNELRVRSWAYKNTIKVDGEATYQKMVKDYKGLTLDHELTLVLNDPVKNHYDTYIQFSNPTHTKVEHIADKRFAVMTYTPIEYIFNVALNAQPVKDQAECYKILKQAVSKGAANVRFKGSVDVESKIYKTWIQEGLKQLNTEEPMSLGITDTVTRWRPGIGVDLLINYGAHPLEMATKTKVDQEIAQKVRTVVKKGMSQKEIAIKLQQVVAERLTYDFDSLYLKDEPVNNVYNAAWRSGKAVCGGYAALYQKMLTLAGLESKMVTGTYKGVGHAWNLVKIDGQYYHIDVTNDDQNDYVRFSHFMKSDTDVKAMGMTFDKAYLKPAPKSYNHYKTLGLSANTETLFLAIVKAQMGTGKPIFVESAQAKTYLESERFKALLLSQYPKGVSYHAIYDGSLMILTLKGQ